MSFGLCFTSDIITKGEKGKAKNIKISCCHVANAFLRRLKLIWPISRLKISKISKKCIFGKKLGESMGLFPDKFCNIIHLWNQQSHTELV